MNNGKKIKINKPSSKEVKKGLKEVNEIPYFNIHNEVLEKVLKEKISLRNLWKRTNIEK